MPIGIDDNITPYKPNIVGGVNDTNMRGSKKQDIGDVYSNRDKGSVNSDFEIWKGKLKEVTDDLTVGTGSGRSGVKSYMNNYAFISFGSYDIGFGGSKNEFVSGSDINGLMASSDEWKVPTTKNIIEWSKKLKSSVVEPFKVKTSEVSDTPTNASGGKDKVSDVEKSKTENDDTFSSGGSVQGIGNFDYDWKDFVFCKNYGKIPNNRLLTLRRYKLPVLDNGTVGAKDELTKLVSETWIGEGQSKEDWIISDSARALTYFGDGSDNTLSGLFGFTVGLEWTPRTTNSENPKYNNNISGDGANFLSDPMDYLQLVKKIPGLDKGGTGIDMLTSALVRNNITNDMKAKGFSESETAEYLNSNVLENDPFQNSWAYRIYGPVNVLLKTYSRKRGLKFSNGNISLTFDYDMAQIGTMNPKLAMIDIISNMLALTTNSGSFWGGDYRFKRDLTSVPIPDTILNTLESMASGGKVDYTEFVNGITDEFDKGFSKIKSSFSSDNLKSYSDNLSQLQSAFTGVGELDRIDNQIKQKEEEVETYKIENSKLIGSTQYNDAISKFNNDIDSLKRGKEGKSNTVANISDVLKTNDDLVRIVLNNGILGRNGDVKSLAKNLMIIKPLITGEPVGEWHLTVGNPMQPIAMIGNLICTGMTMTLSEELGYDDFPTSIKFKVTLDHGRDRDKGDIESMFNMGQGRTYLNIKGATPWETGFSTRSSDNDSGRSANENERDANGNLQVDGRGSRSGAKETLGVDKLEDSKNSLNNDGGGTTIPNWNNESTYPDGSSGVPVDYGGELSTFG